MILQEAHESVKIACKAAEPLNRFARLLWCDCNIMLAVVDVDAGRFRMDNTQPWIRGPDLPVQALRFFRTWLVVPIQLAALLPLLLSLSHVIGAARWRI